MACLVQGEQEDLSTIQWNACRCAPGLQVSPLDVSDVRLYDASYTHVASLWTSHLPLLTTCQRRSFTFDISHLAYS